MLANKHRRAGRGDCRSCRSPADPRRQSKSPAEKHNLGGESRGMRQTRVKIKARCGRIVEDFDTQEPGRAMPASRPIQTHAFLRAESHFDTTFPFKMLNPH
jgi:hypothetical protein